jgi:Terminase large subunit, T4likevirus-type, N-terminal
VNSTTIDALEKEFRRLEREMASAPRSATVPGHPVAFAISLGIEPDEWQVEVLASDHPRKILCCGRQTGKSTVGAVLAVHKALTQPGSTVLVVAPGERQAKLLFSKAASLYRQAGYPLPAHSERRTGLELSNGSVIEALPAVERTVRGFSVDLLVVDEAAAVPDLDYHGILPALIATRGEQVLLSTPRGKRGFFHEIWHSTSSTNGEEVGEETDSSESNSDWQRVMVRSDETPRITTEQLEVFRQSMPEAFYRQEFECEWLDTEGSLFSYEDIQEALELGEDVQALEIGGDEW